MTDAETAEIERRALIIGVEFGYRACEKGMNLQMALESARKIMNAEDEK